MNFMNSLKPIDFYNNQGNIIIGFLTQGKSVQFVVYSA
jgi:hypothetical protein